MRKLSTTVRGLVGTDWVRMTLAVLDSGPVVWVRADGTNAIVGTLASKYRTDADISTQMAKLDHACNAAAVPSVGLRNHEWKGSYTLAELAEHKYQGKALKANMAALLASYAIAEERVA